MSKPKTKFALIDCNNFYVSCERVFDPRMCEMEVIVLSGNDSCVIARSDGAKAMGIKMGEPYFKIKQLAQIAGIIAKSSNLTLYGDMSKRVMNIISKYSPNQEIYSIDESFLEFNTSESQLTTQMSSLKKEIQKGTGIPVCIGLGSTKTLSKLANKIAKNKKSGIVDFDEFNEAELKKVFKTTNIADVWGIGGKYAEKLEKIGINSVFDFYDYPRSGIDNLLGVNGLRVYDELYGIQCFKLKQKKPDQQQIVSSKTFAKEIGEIEELVAAISTLARNAIKRLRKQELYAGTVEIFCNTNPFKDKEQKNIVGIIKLGFSTADYAIIPQITKKLREIYNPAVNYKKAGVVLRGLTKSYHQQDLFLGGEREKPSLEVMNTINMKYPNQAKFCSEITSTEYLYKTSSKSPSYTTDWDEIPKVK